MTAAKQFDNGSGDRPNYAASTPAPGSSNALDTCHASKVVGENEPRADGNLPANLTALSASFHWLQDFGLFDSEWYSERYGVDAGNALSHYFCGENSENNPNPFFVKQVYRELNPDLRDIEMDLFVHYVLFGSTERRAWIPDDINIELSADSWYRGIK